MTALLEVRGLEIVFDTPAGPLAAVAGLVVVSTVLAVLAFFAGLKRTGASTTSILSTFEPVVSTALAAAVLGERSSASDKVCTARDRFSAGKIFQGCCISIYRVPVCNPQAYLHGILVKSKDVVRN